MPKPPETAANSSVCKKGNIFFFNNFPDLARCYLMANCVPGLGLGCELRDMNEQRTVLGSQAAVRTEIA